MCCRLWNKETFHGVIGKKKTEFEGIRHYVARGSGICLPRGYPLASDTHVVSYPNITINIEDFTGDTSRLAYQLIYQGRKIYL